MATIPEGARALLDAPNLAHVATLNADGSPQITPVWIDREADVVLLNTARGRVKFNNLERDPRLAISVADARDPYRYVQIRGRAELVDEGARAHIDKLAQKYWALETYPLPAGEERVIVRVRPESVTYRHS